ncbi:MAG TPA: TIGR03986 family CRISPR-associated RAMP protein [Clostridium sp.]|nr:TIGR03986 family CRISPR-associated RAMP protein [Clostridium sp.]
MGNNEKIVYKSKAPYNFIGLEDFVLDRCRAEEELSMHDRYHENLKTGSIQYEIEVVTPLHISASEKGTSGERGEDKEKEYTGKKELFRNPLGQYVIPGNTIRGLTRYNASIFSFASVINEPKGKKDIGDRRFYYRTFASSDTNIRNWYCNTMGIRQRPRGKFRYTVLERVQAGYIRKRGEEYVITPAVKIGSSDAGDENRMQSYTSIHEWELRKLNLKGIYYLYKDNIKKEDYKDDSKLRRNREIQYRPYIKEIRYNVDGGKPKIDINGKFKGVLANSNYINGKRHHYLIYEEDKNSAEIIVSKKLAELYTEDLEYTHKCNAASKEIYEGKEYYALPKSEEVKPVFYVKEGDKLIFGFTPYLRLPAEGDIYGGIPEVHKDYNGTDFVDALFGWKDFRTKLSFMDAVCDSSSPDITKEYEMMLAEPKPSWYKGYLKQRKDTLESYNTEGYQIRGRKFYWMKNSLDIQGMEEQDKKEKLVTKIKCYAEGTRFIGKIKFENLTEEELGLLIYSLKQGDTDGYFNLGKGKPYGFGKCRIRILEFFTEDIKEKYASFDANYRREEKIDKYVEVFKKYIIEHYRKKVGNINEIMSYREFELSKKFLDNSESRYMKVSEFAQRAELPTLEDAVRETGNVISTKMKGAKGKYNNQKNHGKPDKEDSKKGHYNKQGMSKFNSNNTKTSNLNTEAFNKLKDFKFDNDK